MPSTAETFAGSVPAPLVTAVSFATKIAFAESAVALLSTMTSFRPVTGMSAARAAAAESANTPSTTNIDDRTRRDDITAPPSERSDSLAEHTGFGMAYVLSAGASVVLIAGYSRSVLGGARAAGIMAALLTGLYLFLYLVLQAEDYAMLAGALGLWIILASIMFLTRRIDWYRPRGPKVA